MKSGGAVCMMVGTRGKCMTTHIFYIAPYWLATDITGSTRQRGIAIYDGFKGILSLRVYI